MVTLETYEEMKRLIEIYESKKDIIPEPEQSPYVLTYELVTHMSYNPDFGDDRICECGHSYYRHFDPYENMEAVGCKYCGCYEFKEAKNEKIDNIP
jgi:hypothetical protein